MEALAPRATEGFVLRAELAGGENKVELFFAFGGVNGLKGQRDGDLTKSHYDMNLVGVDVFFRHLLWTGDLAYAKKMWPVIKRHLAWERCLFRREFGADKLPTHSC